MKTNSNNIPRRDFLKTLVAAGVGSTLGGKTAGAGTMDAGAKLDRVPTRPFGRTGTDVSILSLGGMFDIPNNLLMLRQCLNWGVTYWDTANSYEGGRSESGIGKFFLNQPGTRKDVFLVTKTGERSIDGMQAHLDRSLDRAKTDYIDLYFLHSIWHIDEFTPEIRRWADKQKASGKIRLIGFSTHKNMEDCLLGAARTGGVDGIMFTYNYRKMHESRMKKAVDACHEAGIGLTAMKTQGGGSVRTKSEKELKLAGRFVQRGFTEEQAKLKAVWENPQIASICSQMPTLRILMANIAAAIDKTQLTDADREAFREYALATCSGYCAGCGDICAGAAEGAQVSDVMRSLMYYHSYGDERLARETFSQLPAGVRNKLAQTDFSIAESHCPQRMPIGRLMKEAAERFA